MCVGVWLSLLSCGSRDTQVGVVKTVSKCAGKCVPRHLRRHRAHLILSHFRSQQHDLQVEENARTYSYPFESVHILVVGYLSSSSIEPESPKHICKNVVHVLCVPSRGGFVRGVFCRRGI